jgi:hypothetical protein
MSSRPLASNTFSVSLQSTRFPAPLEDEFPQIDTRSFEQNLQYTAKVASVLWFVSESLRKERRWSHLFEYDVFGVLTEIGLFHPSSVLAQLRTAGMKETDKAWPIVAVLSRVDRWLVRLDRCAHPMAEEVKGLIHHTLSHSLRLSRQQLNRLAGHQKGPDGRTLGEVLSGFHHRWGALNEAEDRARYVEMHNEGSVSSAEMLEHIWRRCVADVAYLREGMKPCCDKALTQQGHDPAVALLVTFLKLSERVQALINRFGAKHRDHYYFDLLKLDLEQARPQQVIAQCHLKPTVKALNFDADVAFYAGPSKDCAAMTLVAPAFMSQAEVSTVKSLHLERDPYISPECLLGFATRMKQSRLSSDGAEPISLFGCQVDAHEEDDRDTLEVGFAIAADDFYLGSGVRAVELELSLKDPFESDTTLQALVSDDSLDKQQRVPVIVSRTLELLGFSLSVSCDDISREILAHAGDLALSRLGGGGGARLKKQLLMTIIRLSDDPDDLRAVMGKLLSYHWLSGLSWLEPAEAAEMSALILKKTNTQVEHFFCADHMVSALANLFVVELTGAYGWITADQTLTQMKVPQGEHFTLNIRVQLPQSAAPIVAFDSQVHSGEPMVAQPIFKACLNTVESLYGFSLLDGLVLSAVDIHVQVTKAKEYTAFNEFGRIDITKPYLPFGPIPHSDSFFVMGSYEAALKPVVELSSTIKWQGLPTGNGGFADYYKTYGLNIDNASFRVMASAQVNNHWLDGESRPLFGTELSSGRLSARSVIAFPNEVVVSPVESMTQEMFSQSPHHKNGYYQVRLTAPEFGFGHERYNSVVANHVSTAFRKKQIVELPPAPISPTIEALSVSYRSHQQLNIDKLATDPELSLRLFHIKGDSIWPMVSEPLKYGYSLLPRFKGEGALYIGLAAKVAPSAISLYFDLKQDSQLVGESLQQAIHWQTYTRRGWLSLDERQIVSDGTDYLTRAGVVSLQLPADLARVASEVPKDLFWIRVLTTQNCEGFPSLQRVVANCMALETRAPQGDDVALDAPLATRPKMAQISTVSIVHRTVVERRQDDKRAKITATCEFLRHKRRPVTPWDFERMVLEAFPEVYLAKCFPHAQYDSLSPKPGHILLVVVPYLSPGADPSQGVCANANLLEQVSQYLLAHCAPGIRLRVVNPIYERVQVRCSVVLNELNHNGSGIERLNQDLCHYFNIWKNYRKNIGFGWQLSNELLAGFIGQRPYVQGVSGLSLVHISELGVRHYVLNDTAEGEPSKVFSRYPWSLPLPDKQHVIELISANISRPPRPVGISDMAIGKSLILESEEHGETR